MSREHRRQKKSLQRRRKLKRKQKVRARAAHEQHLAAAAARWFHPFPDTLAEPAHGVPKASATLLEFAAPLLELVDPADSLDEEDYLRRIGAVLAGAAKLWNLALSEAIPEALPPGECADLVPASPAEILEVLGQAIPRPRDEIEDCIVEQVMPPWAELAVQYPGALFPAVQVSFQPDGGLHVLAAGMRLDA